MNIRICQPCIRNSSLCNAGIKNKNIYDGQYYFGFHVMLVFMLLWISEIKKNKGFPTFFFYRLGSCPHAATTKISVSITANNQKNTDL